MNKFIAGTENHGQNTAMGYQAGFNNVTGVSNVYIGSNSGLGATGQSNSTNTGVGREALLSVTTGSGNVAVGNDAGNELESGSYNVLLGYNTQASAASGDNQIVIGIGIAAAGNNDFAFGKASNVVHNDFDADAAWTRTSDIRKKRNIKDDKLGLEFVNKLRTVTHQWKPSNEFPKEWKEHSEENNMNLDVVIHNMIAQDVKKALDEVGCDTFGGWKEREDGSQSLSREMFITPLIKAVQELSEKNEALEKRIEELEG